MKKIVHYIGLDVHKETIAVAIAPETYFWTVPRLVAPKLLRRRTLIVTLESLSQLRLRRTTSVDSIESE